MRSIEEHFVKNLTDAFADAMHPILFPAEQACMETMAKNRAFTKRIARKAALQVLIQSRKRGA
jgi:hypothetical protein